jgi:hypothetical protein
MGSSGTKRLLLGINVSIFGVILALTSSGLAAVALGLGVAGLVISASGMAWELRS